MSEPQNFRDAENSKQCCNTCIFFFEVDHRSGSGECEEETGIGDTNKKMMCDFWRKK